MPKRGRPRRFVACPVCGGARLHVYATRQAGHTRNVYCECPDCNSLLRWMEIGAGRWEQVRARNVLDAALRPDC